MNCFFVSNHLSTYIDGNLPEDQVEALQKHLGECASCNRHEQEIRKCHEQLTALPKQSADPKIRLRLYRRYLQAKRKPRWHQYFWRVSRYGIPIVIGVTVLMWTWVQVSFRGTVETADRFEVSAANPSPEPTAEPSISPMPVAPSPQAFVPKPARKPAQASAPKSVPKKVQPVAAEPAPKPKPQRKEIVSRPSPSPSPAALSEPVESVRAIPKRFQPQIRLRAFQLNLAQEGFLQACALHACQTPSGGKTLRPYRKLGKRYFDFQISAQSYADLIENLFELGDVIGPRDVGSGTDLNSMIVVKMVLEAKPEPPVETEEGVEPPAVAASPDNENSTP